MVRGDGGCSDDVGHAWLRGAGRERSSRIKTHEQINGILSLAANKAHGCRSAVEKGTVTKEDLLEAVGRAEELVPGILAAPVMARLDMMIESFSERTGGANPTDAERLALAGVLVVATYIDVIVSMRRAELSGMLHPEDRPAKELVVACTPIVANIAEALGRAPLPSEVDIAWREFARAYRSVCEGGQAEFTPFHGEPPGDLAAHVGIAGLERKGCGLLFLVGIALVVALSRLLV